MAAAGFIVAVTDALSENKEDVTSYGPFMTRDDARDWIVDYEDMFFGRQMRIINLRATVAPPKRPRVTSE